MYSANDGIHRPPVMSYIVGVMSLTLSHSQMGVVVLHEVCAIQRVFEG